MTLKILSLLFYLNLLALWCEAALARGKVSVETDRQHGVMIYESEVTRGHGWKTFCRRLGARLKIKHEGFLRTVQCRGSEDISLHANQRWIFRFVEKEQSFVLEIVYRGRNQFLPIQSYEFQSSSLLQSHFSNSLLIESLAKLMLNVVPVGRVLLPMVEAISLESEQEKLLVYQLSFDYGENLWLPEIKGRYLRDEGRVGQGDLNSVYLWDGSYEPLITSQRYWMKPFGLEDEESIYRAKILATLNRDHSSDSHFLDAKHDHLPQVFFEGGLRQGISILKRDPLTDRAYFTNLFLTARSGPLNSLHFNFEIIPSLRRANDNEIRSFDYNRSTLALEFGYSFAENFQTSVDQITFRPKIGRVNVKYHRDPLVRSPGHEKIVYEVENRPEISLEIGLQKSWGETDLKISVGASTADFGLTSPEFVSLKGIQVGIESRYEIFHGEGGAVHLSNFLTHEKMMLRKAKGSLDKDILSTDVGLLFGGLGLSVSW